MTQFEDRLKAWSAPILAALVFGMAAYVWSGQTTRISTLEIQANATGNALATIQANQTTSLADRAEFQASTTATLNKLSDTLSVMGQNLSVLQAIQQRQEQQAKPHLESAPI